MEIAAYLMKSTVCKRISDNIYSVLGGLPLMGSRNLHALGFYGTKPLECYIHSTKCYE